MPIKEKRTSHFLSEFAFRPISGHLYPTFGHTHDQSTVLLEKHVLGVDGAVEPVDKCLRKDFRTTGLGQPSQVLSIAVNRYGNAERQLDAPVAIITSI